MIEPIQALFARFNALTIRERSLVGLSVVFLSYFLWWTYYAQPLLDSVHDLQKQNETITQEMNATRLAAAAIQKRLNEGVHKDKLALIDFNQRELQRINGQLDQLAYQLVEPDEMFQLMQQLVFANSRLKLDSLARKSVAPVFTPSKESVEQDDEAVIYRHTMAVSLQGKYQDILAYVKHLEQTDWKLLWDKIVLKTIEYPVIAVDLELSTISKSQKWVGL